MRLIRTTIVSVLVAMSLAPIAALAQTSVQVTNAFDPGDLIKGSTAAVYYFASDGRRFTFPNEKTYFTWYADFKAVKTISDQALAVIPMGGAVTYRPGFKMLKLATNPKVYAIDRGGIMRHVTSEQMAETLYGLNWKNRIDDLPEAFFPHYRVGLPIQASADYSPDDVKTLTVSIAQDKGLERMTATVTIGDDTTGFVPTTLTVKRGTEVTWTNRDVLIHRIIGNGWESWLLSPGASFSREFNAVGSFEYFESARPSIRGVISVVP